MVLLPEPLVLELNEPFDIPLGDRYLALAVPTLVGPAAVGDVDLDGKQHKQNHTYHHQGWRHPRTHR